MRLFKTKSGGRILGGKHADFVLRGPNPLLHCHASDMTCLRPAPTYVVQTDPNPTQFLIKTDACTVLCMYTSTFVRSFVLHGHVNVSGWRGEERRGEERDRITYLTLFLFLFSVNWSSPSVNFYFSSTSGHGICPRNAGKFREKY